MKLVIDASMALAWLFERQTPSEMQCAEQALLALTNVDAWVPSLWHIEIANALLVGERRKVVTEAQVMDYLHRLSQLPIATEENDPSHCRDRVMALAREYNLTAYDAIYLELALRNNATLATFDAKLASAMKQAGGAIFGNA